LRAGGGKAVCHELEAVGQAQLLEAGGDFLLGVEAVGLAFGGGEGEKVERMGGAAAHIGGKRTDFAVGVGGGEGGPIAAAAFVVDGAFRQVAEFVVGLGFMTDDFAVLIVLGVDDLAIAIFVRQGGGRCFGIHLAVAVGVSTFDRLDTAHGVEYLPLRKHCDGVVWIDPGNGQCTVNLAILRSQQQLSARCGPLHDHDAGVTLVAVNVGHYLALPVDQSNHIGAGYHGVANGALSLLQTHALAAEFSRIGEQWLQCCQSIHGPFDLDRVMLGSQLLSCEHSRTHQGNKKGRRHRQQGGHASDLAQSRDVDRTSQLDA
jgi:hypothetical protein